MFLEIGNKYRKVQKKTYTHFVCTISYWDIYTLMKNLAHICDKFIHEVGGLGGKNEQQTTTTTGGNLKTMTKMFVCTPCSKISKTAVISFTYMLVPFKTFDKEEGKEGNDENEQQCSESGWISQNVNYWIQNVYPSSPIWSYFTREMATSVTLRSLQRNHSSSTLWSSGPRPLRED